jgi:hypothetical protein
VYSRQKWCRTPLDAVFFRPAWLAATKATAKTTLGPARTGATGESTSRLALSSVAAALRSIPSVVRLASHGSAPPGRGQGNRTPEAVAVRTRPRGEG